ncbi:MULTISPECIES: PAQR family membrane homeostasis protein TrhA [Priestia]|jgi:hemolysin III|uniref:Hemolysin III n=6 Tax=Priestia TaxID=2800373 RepID=D5E2B2_PRIM1|nr:MULTISPECIES: hemolysin III family protein [Priestia]AVX07105.1 hemolysin D [Bacillus sp. Y-01]KOP73294.1 hemolysin D [Bacillus sp. FJAT-21351]KQU18869.1 hemolysin D [Bacillus sp. Leaf75]KRD84657.1 hemolysin D [Bacillus sp. Root147]KRF52920.1 hemolysin D [Bacillus sp. Soil531]MBK0291429.1 hemolysin III family protein [Bacillus sp. S34]MBZ5479486.1 hemolysin III family protein [Bacillus sp. T_4]MCF6794838.1 hemolysin III family protein [Bacillus sp. ET1]MCL6709572.1 hemolysin III family 
MATTHTFTRGEEIANAITHGVGAVLSIVGLTLLIVLSSLEGTPWHVISFTIYGVTMLLLYVSSTLVHSFPEGKVKDLFEIFDHSSIYLFIAGTYTPFLFIAVKGTTGWTLFGIVWGIALAGIVFKAFFVKKFLFISTILYVFMGWMIVFAWDSLTQNIAHQGIVLLVVGGVLYTIGAVFYVWRGFRFHHMIWHMFVLGGTVLHFLAIILYVLPITN